MRIWIIGLLPAVLIALALPATALPGISLSEPLPETGPDECALLTQIKFPWLICKTDAQGHKRIVNSTVAANANWEDLRRIPLGDEFVEGEGNWLSIAR